MPSVEPKTSVLIQHGIMTRAQLRQELSLSDETLSRMEREDGFPARRSKKVILYDVGLIKKWIAAAKG